MVGTETADVVIVGAGEFGVDPHFRQHGASALTSSCSTSRRPVRCARRGAA
jgi:hypothetical protein